MEILKNWGDAGGGLYFLGKYAHVLAGVAWIGLLYFFNFVQVPAYAELSAGARTEAFDKVTWRAPWLEARPGGPDCPSGWPQTL